MVIKTGYQPQQLWQGPSKLITVRTGKILPLSSLLDPNDDGGSGMNKLVRTGPVYLGHSAFDQDERAYEEHQEVDRAVLQYNHQHYQKWKIELASISKSTQSARNKLLAPGGFGENFAAEADPSDIFMDEHTVCVGDLVGVMSFGNEVSAIIQITGPRNPCYKLNHRFGVKNMAQRAQESFRTGWLSRSIQQGYVQINDNLVLLERPFPDWPVARVQHYVYKDPRNFDMIRECLDTIGPFLVGDIKKVLTNRLSKGMENWNGRLGVSSTTPETFSAYQLISKIRDTARVTSFIFTRTSPLSDTDSRFLTAEPGSHVRLRFHVNSKGQQIQIIRPYSVISGTTNNFTLGVTLADVSRGGSSYLHTLQVGQTIEACDQFANTFPLSEDADKHIFLAGGIGITAFLDHIQHCRKNGIAFELHYMVRNEADIAYRALLENIPNTNKSAVDSNLQVNIYISSTGQRADISSILAGPACQTTTHVYTCGSKKLSTAVTTSARTLNIVQHRLHFEQFSIDASGDLFVVELVKSGREVEIPGHLSLLEAMQDIGYMVPSSCEAGNCGTCRVRVVAGRVEHRGTALLEEEKAGWNGEEDGEMLACVSRGIGRICIDW